MADIKISQLPQSTQLTGNEIVPLDQVQGGNLITAKATTQDIANLASLGYTAENVANKSTDGTFASNSDTLYPSQKATKTYVDGVAVGLLKDNGNYDPTVTSEYPTSANTLSGGNPQKGDIWYIGVNGTINGHAVLAGYSVRALVNNAGATTDANWSISNVGLGYVPENVANKSTNTSLGTSDTLYPTQNAVKTYVDNANVVPTLQEVLDNNHDLLNNNNYQGTDAGYNNSGAQVNAIGYNAAKNNSESNINALGSYAAENNSGSDLNAFGNNAGKNNTGTNVNAFGSNAGIGNTFSNVNLLGADTTASGDYQTVLKGSSGDARIDTSSLTADTKYTIPAKVGDQTFAMLSDITNSSGWSLIGNAGTNPSTNFIGTTDAQDVVFKANNYEAFRIVENGTSPYAKFKGYANAIDNTEAGFSASDLSYSKTAWITSNYNGNTNKPALVLSETYIGNIRLGSLTADRTYTLPDASGTLATTDGATTIKISLNSTQLQSISGVNEIILIPSQTGKVICPISTFAVYAYGTTPYTSGVSILLKLASGSGTGIGNLNFGGTTVDLVSKLNNNNSIQNAGLATNNYISIGAIGSGSMGSGDGTLDLYITYAVL